jgi:hypothetical protein
MHMLTDKAILVRDMATRAYVERRYGLSNRLAGPDESSTARPSGPPPQTCAPAPWLGWDAWVTLPDPVTEGLTATSPASADRQEDADRMPS